MNNSVNITDNSIINTTFTDGNHNIIEALNITCRLYSANTVLIPDIKNATEGETSGILAVLEKLSNASLTDSCSWLQQEVRDATQRTFSCSALQDICMLWSSSEDYRTAISSVEVVQSGIEATSNSIKNSYLIQSFSDVELRNSINTTLQIFNM